MSRRILTLLFALLLLPLHASADTVTVTARSSGTMVALGEAERLLELPPGPADYELSFTSTLPAGDIDVYPGSTELSSWGPLEVTLQFRGIRHSFSIPDGMSWILIASDLGREDLYRHSMTWPMIVSSFGLEGMMSFGLPAGGYPGTGAFSTQDFAVTDPATSLVELRVYQNGEVTGQLTGTADRFEVSIVSAVPEPSLLAGLCAGLAILGAAARRRARYAAAAPCACCARGC